MNDIETSSKTILVWVVVIGVLISGLGIFYVIKNINIDDKDERIQNEVDSLKEIRKQKKIEDSLRRELEDVRNLQRKEELEKKRSEKEELDKRKEEEVIQKYHAYGSEWIFVCFGSEDGSKWYIMDETPYRESNDIFYVNGLVVYKSSGYMTDNSILATSGYTKYNLSKQTTQTISQTVYYAGKPSKSGLTYAKERNISSGSVEDLMFNASKNRLK